MADPSFQTTQLQDCLERMRAGDVKARDELLGHAYLRLQRLTRKMLKGYPGVKRWAQTDDVLQNALVRLLRALQEVSPPSVRDFFALTTEQIRRELLDLARHYKGKLLAILVDGKVISASRVSAKISSIDSQFGVATKAEAERIAKRINGK